MLLTSLISWAEIQSAKFSATELGKRWWQHDQFGIFYDANDSNWYYHLDHGWIYVDEWDDNGTWMYMANENTSQNTYFHYDGNQYNLITDWEEIADSTGLSLEFLQAVTTASGTDINFTNANQQDVHVSDVVMPFGWVWTSSSTRDFLYNNYLDEWLYFSRKIKDSDYRYYSYKTKSYINNKEIRELEYSPDIWREVLAGFGFDVYLNLDGLDQIKDLNESHENIFGGNAGKLRIKIPKEQIDEDNFWSPLVSNLEQFDNLSNGELFKLLQIDENQESVTITVRTLFHSINVAEKVNSVSSVSLLGVDDRRQASARGLDDNSSKEAILLEKAGIIDLNDADYERKLDKYVEVAKVASNKFEEKVQGRDAYRKDAERFTRDLVSNFEQVVDLVIETESIGIQDYTVLDSLLENSDNAKEVNEIQKEAQNLGIRDKQTLEAVFRNADKVVELKSVINDAKALDIYDLDHIAPVLLNAYQVVSLKKVIEASDEVGAKDKENLGAVFQNADKADELKEVIDIAAEIGAKDKENLRPLLLNADKAVDMRAVVDFAQKYDLTTDNLREVFQQPERAEELNELILAETLQNIDDLDEETIQEILQSPTAIAYTLPAREILTASMTKLRAIEKEDVAPEIKTIARGIKIGDIDIGVIADIAVSSKVNAANIPLTEIKQRAEILQVYAKSGLSGDALATIAEKIDVESNKWQNSYVTVEGTSLKFSGNASNVGDVVLENVTHPNIGTLSEAHLPEVSDGF